MMLRSSSTPLLGSLLISSETSNHQSENKHTQISCGSIQDFRTSFFHSTEIIKNGLRRVQSDGNLGGLDDVGHDMTTFSNKLGSKSRRNSIGCCTMRPIPSFEYDNDEELHDGFKAAAMRMQEEMRKNDFVRYGGDEGEGKMYLATGLGGGGGGTYRPVAFDKGGSMEEHYKKMLDQNPGNSLLLTNYAHFLYKVKGDGEAAEEYYSRAILANDGEDGEIMSQYAILMWELHRDRDTAANYFQRAIQISSDSSHIQAAYANFLWDTEDEEEDAAQHSLFHHGSMASTTA